MRSNMALKSTEKQRRFRFLKLVGVREFYNITKAKIVSAVNCCIVVSACATATFAVDAALNTPVVQAYPVETSAATSLLPEQPDPDETENTVPSETSEVTETSESTSASSASSTEASASSETTGTSESQTTSETTEETAATTTAEETTEATTAATTATTTAETKETVTEKELYLAVYATTTVNVRSGPGTEYDVVKNVYTGDQIDVIAVTSNGWYKTYNGNYVKKSLTTETKPKATSTPKPTQRQTEEETTVATTTESQREAPSGNGNRCTITFFGPQPNGDGTYNYSTATGTTCTEGRTCAADWSIYPAGTVIYIEDDPLGGDGYYTVEDRGSGVNGYHIDIYADDGESGNYHTCYRNVIVP